MVEEGGGCGRRVPHKVVKRVHKVVKRGHKAVKRPQNDEKYLGKLVVKSQSSPFELHF